MTVCKQSRLMTGVYVCMLEREVCECGEIISCFQTSGQTNRHRERQTDTKRLLAVPDSDPWLGWQGFTSSGCLSACVCWEELQDVSENLIQIPFSSLVHEGFGLIRQLLS